MRKLSRKKDNREQLIRNLVTSVILYENVQTTLPKAKETLKMLEKMINLAKKQTLVAKRELLAYLTHKNATKKVFEELVVRYKDKTGGYAKLYNLGYRVGDGAPKVLIRLINKPVETKKEIHKPETKEKK